MITSRLCLAVAALCACTLSVHAEAEKGCYGARGSDTKSINGYTIISKAFPNQEKFIDECMAVIKDAKGKTVFVTHDHAIEILPISGEDINGDAQPEAIIEGYSGGAHCCWTYWIVSLEELPRVLVRIYNERNVSFRKIKEHPGVTLDTLDGRFDYFDDMCHACTPFPGVYLRLEGVHLVDVSSEFWTQYQKEIDRARGQLSSEELTNFRTQWRKDQPGDRNTFEDTRRKVLTIVLSYLYGGKPDEAWKALKEMWPPGDTARIEKLIVKTRGHGFVAWVQDPSNFEN